jgi:hypothetical protein
VKNSKIYQNSLILQVPYLFYIKKLKHFLKWSYSVGDLHVFFFFCKKSKDISKWSHSLSDLPSLWKIQRFFKILKSSCFEEGGLPLSLEKTNSWSLVTHALEARLLIPSWIRKILIRSLMAWIHQSHVDSIGISLVKFIWKKHCLML